VRYLPTWDTTLLAHARRARIVPEEQPGLWRLKGGRIRLEPFGRLSRAVRAGLEEEGERLEAFHS